MSDSELFFDSGSAGGSDSTQRDDKVADTPAAAAESGKGDKKKKDHKKDSSKKDDKDDKNDGHKNDTASAPHKRTDEELTRDLLRLEEDISVMKERMSGATGLGNYLQAAVRYAKMFLDDEMSEGEEDLYMASGAAALTEAFMSCDKLDYYYTFQDMLHFVVLMICVLEKGLKTNKIKCPAALAAALILPEMPYWRTLARRADEAKHPAQGDEAVVKATLKEQEKKFTNEHKTKSSIAKSPLMRMPNFHTWYYYTINIFDDHGCFDMLCSWVLDTNNTMDAYQLKILFMILELLPDFTTGAFVSRVSKQILGNMLDRYVVLSVQHLTTKESQQSKEVYNRLYGCWKRAKVIAPLVFGSTEGNEMLDSCRFRIAANEVNCGSLETRVSGLDSLCTMVDRTEVSDGIINAVTTMMTYPDPRRPALKPLKKELLCGWLMDPTLGLMDKLLDFSREEVIKLNTKILLFIVRNGTLRRTFIKELWNKADGQHESLKLAIYNSIALFLPVLASSLPTEIETLYSLLKDLDFKNHDASTLTLISKLLIQEYSDPKHSQLDYMKKHSLWNVLIHFFSFEPEDGLEPSEKERLENLAEKANELICKVLEQPVPQSEQSSLVSECGSFIEKSKAVLRCLQLILFILNHIKKNRASIARSLCEPSQLVFKVVTEFGSYLSTAKNNLNAINAKLDSKLDDQAIAERVLVGTRSHKEQLIGRFRFIASVLRMAERGTPKELFEALFDSIGSNLLSETEKNDFFCWLLALVAPDKYFLSHEIVVKNSTLSKQVVELFSLTDKRLSPDNITRYSFELFWRLFMLSNMVQGCVSVERVPMKPDWRTFDIAVNAKTASINGLQKLWDFVLHCEDETVGTLAAQCLNKLYSGKTTMEVNDTHIGKCIEILLDYKNQRACIVNRCLALVMHMVEQSQRGFLEKKRMDAARLKQQSHAQEKTQQSEAKQSDVIQPVLIIENPAETKRRSSSVSTTKKITMSFTKFFNKELSFDYEGKSLKRPPQQITPAIADVTLRGPYMRPSAKLGTLRSYLSLNLVRQTSGFFTLGRTVTFNKAIPPDNIHLFLGDKDLYHTNDDQPISSFGIKNDTKITVRIVPLEEDGEIDAVHIGTPEFIGDIQQKNKDQLSLIPEKEEGEEKEVLFLEHRARHADSISSPFFFEAEQYSQPLLNRLFSDPSMKALHAIINDPRCSSDPEWRPVGLLCWELIQRLPCKEVTKWKDFKQEWTNIGDAEGHIFPLLNDLAEIDALLHSRNADVAAHAREAFLNAGNGVKILNLLRSSFIRDNYAQSQPARILCTICLSILHTVLIADMGRSDGMKQKIIFEKDAVSLVDKSDVEVFFNLCDFVVANSKNNVLKPKENALIASPRDMENNESLIIMYALDIICGIVGSIEDASHSFDVLLQNNSMWLCHLLVFTSAPTRSVAAEGIVCLLLSNPLPVLVKQICSFVPQLDAPDVHPESFFALLKHYISKNILSHEELISVRDTIIQLMRSHKTTESFREMRPDGLLNNLFDVLLVMFQKYPKTILGYSDSVQHTLDDETKKVIDFLFNHCLFVTPAEANSFLRNGEQSGNIPPRCKVSRSRKKVLMVLELIATQKCNPAAFAYITRLIHTYVGSIDLSEDWNVLPPNDGNVSNILGLRNLGATCYMNSILQQLFHVKAFRNTILGLPQFDHEDDSESGEMTTLFQLQVLFARLKESATAYANTRDFAKSVRIYGQPIQTSVQMDANEFFASLFASLEGSLAKIPGQKNMLQSLFGGTTVTQVVCGENPTHVSQNPESFYAVSVDVKNTGNLQRGLSSMIAGENMIGDNQYMCSSCNKKVDAVRRTLFKSLPPVLVVHLKRFEYSVQHGAQIKLYERCEFPMIIDMEPYMLKEDGAKSESKDSEEKEPEEKKESSDESGNKPSYKYRLCGIVVHNGSANGGHYYSYHRHPNDPNKWIELNDDNIIPFDPRTIPENCFGNSLDPKAPVVKKSAYMLFYERLSPDDKVEQPATNEQPQSEKKSTQAPAIPPAATAAAATALVEESPESDREIAAEKIICSSDEKGDREGVIMNPEVQQIIVQENAAARMKSYVFSPDFSSFIWDLANKWKSSINEGDVQSLLDAEKDMVDTECLAFGLFLRVMFDVLPHGAKCEMISAWELNMIEMLKSSRRIEGHLLYLLSRNPDFMRSIFIDSPKVEARVHLVHAIIVAIRDLEKEESNDMLTTSYDDLEQEAKNLTQSLQGFTKTDVWCHARLEDSMMHSSYIPLFMKLAMDLWYYAATNSRPYPCQMFFALFLELVKIGSVERLLLCDKLAFFNKATSLLCHRIPGAPKSIPTFTASIAEAEDEPDEKDIIHNSGFAELYCMKKKEKPKNEVKAYSGKSALRNFDLVYLLEALTVIVQNAQLPTFEAPPAMEDNSKKGKKDKKADKKGDKKSDKEKAEEKPSQSEASPAAAKAAAAAASEAKPAVVSDKKDAVVHNDQLTAVLTNVLPSFIQSGTGIYAVKEFVLKLTASNAKAISLLTPMFGEFLSRPSSSFSRQMFSEIVLAVLSVKDGATDKRLSEYMTFHLSFISDLIRSEHRMGPTLAEPLEALAAIVNSGSKEVKEEYRRAASEIFTDPLLDEGKFTPSYP